MESNQSNQLNELWKYIIESEKDLKYQKEGRPALLFSILAHKLFGIQINDLRENINDPPDYLLDIDSRIVNLEVTVFAEEFFWGKNAFLKRIESIIEEGIVENESLLPNGIYMFNYFPTSKDRPKIPLFWISLPDFKNRIDLIYLKKNLPEVIKRWFNEYNTDRTKILCNIDNKYGQKIGEIQLLKFGNHDYIKWIIGSQRVTRMNSWTKESFQRELQQIVDKKSSKYRNSRKLTKKYPGEWWLLISDIHNFMNTHYFDFDLNEISITSNFFNKVFFMPGFFGRSNINEIHVIKDDG